MHYVLVFRNYAETFKDIYGLEWTLYVDAYMIFDQRMEDYII